MKTRQFQAESKRLLDLMINSIYTHKEIFLRELISNASDAIDKNYYRILTSENITFDKNDFYIQISIDKDARTLTIEDTGIGMNMEDMEENLGTIAKSGSLAFKQQVSDTDSESKDEVDIIGQFGVGFYSAFMVSDKVTVISRKVGEEKAFRWVSEGADGYVVEECEREKEGTTIILEIKENADETDYDQYLEDYKVRSLVKKYSDFIKYPVKMGDEVINSMVPLWKKNKSEITEEDYENFYKEKHFGFDKPLKSIYYSVDGVSSFTSILYIPGRTPFDFYSKDFERGLELYSNNVMIMQKCQDLLPEYFGFVQGVVDSQDLSLNISRELLQHDRQLQFISKKIKEKIKKELLSMQKDDRENYVTFFEAFGRTLKFGLYSEYGMNRDILEDLIMFYSSTKKELVTLKEYVERMGEDQKYIYYATGENVDKIGKLPQLEIFADKNYEVLFFNDEVDEFAIRVLASYSEKEFKSISSGDLELEKENDESEENKKESDQNKELFDFVTESLGGKIKSAKASKKLKTHPVCLSSEGELSIEMEKVLSMMPDGGGVKAEKILEINTSHKIFELLKESFVNDKDKAKKIARVLYNQALLIEGLSVEDPVEYANDVCSLMM
ncbi:molecular chaperone HtpG [Proteocatella sphenisci]|uniref:molecular chaperone HtpG n=1 Tax=Proteocatella sphenisci TaxID=181070 RepID=UPI00049023DC|nr:molecular chaperone HtpG [Proteocatella sphenisci]